MTRPFGLSTRVVALGPLLTQWRDASRAYADILQDCATDRFFARLQLCEWRVDTALHAQIDHTLQRRRTASLPSEHSSDKRLPTHNAGALRTEPFQRFEPKDFPATRPRTSVTQSFASRRSNLSAFGSTSEADSEVQSAAAPMPRSSCRLESSFALPLKGQANPDRVRSYLQQMVPPGSADHDDGVQTNERASDLRNPRRTAPLSAHNLANREGRAAALIGRNPNKVYKQSSRAERSLTPASLQLQSSAQNPSATRNFAYHSPVVAPTFDDPQRGVVSEILARDHLWTAFETQATPLNSSESDRTNSAAFQQNAPDTVSDGSPKAAAFSRCTPPTSSMDPAHRTSSHLSPVEPTRVDPRSTSKSPEFSAAIPSPSSSAFPDTNATQRSQLQRSQAPSSGLSGLLDAWQSHADAAPL